HDLHAVAARLGVGLRSPAARVADPDDQPPVSPQPELERRLARVLAVRVADRVRAALAAGLDHLLDLPFLQPLLAEPGPQLLPDGVQRARHRREDAVEDPRVAR